MATIKNAFRDIRSENDLLESPKVPKDHSFVTSKPKPGRTKLFGSVVAATAGIARSIASKISGSTGATLSSASSLGATIQEETNAENLRVPQIEGVNTSTLTQGKAIGQTLVKSKVKSVISSVPVAAGVPTKFSRFKKLADLQKSKFYSTIGSGPRLFKEIDPTKGSQGVISVPVSPAAPEYPYNEVKETPGGHVFEIDNTPGKERLHTYHRSGTFEEIHPDGTKVDHVVKDRYTVTMGDEFIIVNGSCKITVRGGDVKLLAETGSIELETKDGGVAINAKGQVKIHADDILFKAKNSINLDAPKLQLGQYLSLPGSPVLIYGIPVPRLTLPGIKLGSFPSPGGTAALVSSFKPTLTTITSPFIGLGAAAIASFTASAATMLLATKTAAVGTIDVRELLPQVKVPKELPLSNPTYYLGVTEVDRAQRYRMFDSPDAVADVEQYSTHVELSIDQGDYAVDSKTLPGQLEYSDTDTPEREPDLTIRPFSEFLNNYDWSAASALGTSGLSLAHLMPSANYALPVSPEIGGSATVTQSPAETSGPATVPNLPGSGGETTTTEPRQEPPEI